MSDERRSEILKAAGGGLTATEIAAAEGLSAEQVGRIIAARADEMAAIRQHMQDMGWLEED